MTDKQFAILKVYSEHDSIEWDKLLNEYTNTPDFMSWGVDKNDIIGAEHKQLQHVFKLIERLPESIAYESYKITPKGSAAYNSHALKQMSKEKIASSANAVLNNLINSSGNPKRLNADSPGLNYEHTKHIFEFIEERCPNFINVFQGTGSMLNIQMKGGVDDEIKDFLDNGGFEMFDNRIAYNKFKREENERQKHSSKTINITGPVSGGNINQSDDLRDNASIQFVNNEAANAPKQNDVEQSKTMWSKIKSFIPYLLGSGGIAGLAKLIYDWLHHTH